MPNRTKIAQLFRPYAARYDTLLLPNPVPWRRGQDLRALNSTLAITKIAGNSMPSASTAYYVGSGATFPVEVTITLHVNHVTLGAYYRWNLYQIDGFEVTSVGDEFPLGMTAGAQPPDTLTFDIPDTQTWPANTMAYIAVELMLASDNSRLDYKHNFQVKNYP